MKPLAKLHVNPNSMTEVLRALDYAIDIGPWLTPEKLVSEEVAELVTGVDHIALPASFEFVTSIDTYLASKGFSDIFYFDSKVASKEYDRNITIMNATSDSVCLEIMLSYKSLHPTPHVALALKNASYFEQVIVFMEEVGMHPPSFMSNGPIKNKKQGVSVLYMDGDLTRLEFIARDKNENIF